MQFNQSLKRLALLLFALATAPISTFAADANEFTIRSLPPFVAYAGTVVLVVIAIRIGFLLGIRRHRFLGSVKDEAVLPVSGSLMGLLAFLLAFMFNISMNRFDTRRMLFLEHLSVIETFHRRAELLPEKYRTAIQAELVKFIDVSMQFTTIRTEDESPPLLRKQYEVESNLWAIVNEMRSDPELSGALFVMSANELTDFMLIHNKRVTITTIYHLPTAMWGILYALLIMAMLGMGYLFGMDARMNWIMVSILAMSFSAVVIVISDLDRTRPNIITFSRQSMLDLRERLDPPGQ